MSLQDFNQKEWEERLASALIKLHSKQGSFLETYWKTNGYPTQISFNGRDETPFPSHDLFDLYEAARHSEQFGNAAHYKPLCSFLDPVRGVLRSHPTLARALGVKIGNDNFHVGILNGSSWACLNHLIAGQMARRAARKDNNFDNSVAELNSLLLLSNKKRSTPLKGDLDLGFDVVLFYGIQIQDCIDLGEGYSLMPYSKLSGYLEREVLDEVAPDQVQSRDLSLVFGVVREFRWMPRILPMNKGLDQSIRKPPPLFQRWSLEFANLLSVVLCSPIICMMVLEGCVSQITCDLLGTSHNFSAMRKGSFVGHLHDPFRKPKLANLHSIETARELFAKRRETKYPELVPVILRMAEALSRDGRHAAQDKVLDLAIAFERLFKPRSGSIGKDLKASVSDLLGSNQQSKEALKQKMKHFYDVRSAIIHGPNGEKKERLLKETKEAFQNGFEIAQQSLLKKLS